MKSLFLMSILFPFYVHLNGMHKESPPSSSSLIFENDFKKYQSIADVTLWSATPQTKELITKLSQDRPKSKSSNHPKVLFYGDRGHEAALTLASKIQFRYLIIEPSTTIDDHFINLLQRPQQSHTIIIKSLSALFLYNMFKNSDVKKLSNQEKEAESAAEKFTKLLSKLTFSHTYLICSQPILSDLPETLKTFFIQLNQSIPCIAQVNAHSDELYYHNIWPFMQRNNLPRLCQSIATAQLINPNNHTQDINQLISVFKNNQVLPHEAHSILEHIPIDSKKNCYGLDSIKEKINLLKQNHRMLHLNNDNNDKQLRSTCCICREERTSYLLTPCCPQKLNSSEASDHIICSTCINDHYNNNKSFDCPFCRQSIKTQTVFKVELIINKEPKK